MKQVKSAGGVVYIGTGILMLRKINGDWVLPKGKVEKSETQEEAALREVKEETSIKAKMITRLGETQYTFKNFWSKDHLIEKKVVWYLMKALTTNPYPQREEGFVEAKFIHMNQVLKLARYDDEKKILIKALTYIEAQEG